MKRISINKFKDIITASWQRGVSYSSWEQVYKGLKPYWKELEDCNCEEWEGKYDMEKLAEAVHKAYCKYHLENKGKEYWTKGDYSLLKDEGKEYDRRTVRAVIQAIAKTDIIKVKP